MTKTRSQTGLWHRLLVAQPVQGPLTGFSVAYKAANGVNAPLFTDDMVNIGMMVASDMELKGKLVRYMDPAGKIFATGVGALSLALGATASGLGNADGSLDAGDIAANVLGTMPNLFSFLRLESLADISEGTLPATKLLIDFFTGEGTAVGIGAS
jgi:hypothetical protein